MTARIDFRDCQPRIRHVRVSLHFNYCNSMSDKTNEARIKDIIVDQLGVNEDQVTVEAKLMEDLGADSLDAVELVMAIEEEFGIEVPDDEAEKLASMGDIIAYIEKSGS